MKNNYHRINKFAQNIFLFLFLGLNSCIKNILWVIMDLINMFLPNSEKIFFSSKDGQLQPLDSHIDTNLFTVLVIVLVRLLLAFAFFSKAQIGKQYELTIVMYDDIGHQLSMSCPLCPVWKFREGGGVESRGE